MSRIAEVLAALREERQNLLAEVSRIDRAIAALEDAAGTGPPATVATKYPKDALGRTPGPYSMFTVCEAAATYLASAGEPKTTREIAAALRAGGIRTTSEHFTDTVGKMLRKSASDFGIRHTSDRKRWFVKR